VAEANMTRELGSTHGQFIADAPAYVAALVAEVERLQEHARAGAFDVDTYRKAIELHQKRALSEGVGSKAWVDARLWETLLND
jgi:plasmid stabilization system protein ParE